MNGLPKGCRPPMGLKSETDPDYVPPLYMHYKGMKTGSYGAYSLIGKRSLA